MSLHHHVCMCACECVYVRKKVESDGVSSLYPCHCNIVGCRFRVVCCGYVCMRVHMCMF